MTTSAVQLKEAPTLSRPGVVLAILAVVLWAAIVMFLFFRAGSTNEVTWTRYAFLFASVEAVAFAAGGAIWGNSIQRDRAEKAEQAAESNAQDSANGRALASSLIADGQEVPDGGRLGVQGFGSGGDTVADRHARLAKSLFPDV